MPADLESVGCRMHNAHAHSSLILLDIWHNLEVTHAHQNICTRLEHVSREAHNTFTRFHLQHIHTGVHLCWFSWSPVTALTGARSYSYHSIILLLKNTKKRKFKRFTLTRPGSSTYTMPTSVFPNAKSNTSTITFARADRSTYTYLIAFPNTKYEQHRYAFTFACADRSTYTYTNAESNTYT